MNKVLIVDDHPVIRLAVRLLMERHGYEVVAETDNGVDALQLARDHAPDIVILDIGIPKLEFSMRCMQAGAAGYVCKQQDLTELLSAIKAVLSGYSYFPNQALHSVRASLGNASEADMVDRLSGREMMVLQQLAKGKSNKQIADGMFLSNKTVSTYKTRLLQKLNARSLVDLIELAQRNGLA
ncbi:LuxR family transcriptional regulator [Pseudomonas putida]|nr:LuxR family transcriptional regulator [Pseudomonas putida]